MPLIVIGALLPRLTDSAILLRRISSTIYCHLLNIVLLSIVTENVTFAVS